MFGRSAQGVHDAGGGRGPISVTSGLWREINNQVRFWQFFSFQVDFLVFSSDDHGIVVESFDREVRLAIFGIYSPLLPYRPELALNVEELIVAKDKSVVRNFPRTNSSGPRTILSSDCVSLIPLSNLPAKPGASTKKK